MNEKILTTSKLPKREVDGRVNAGGGFIQIGRPALMTKDAYIAKYGTEAEKNELVRRIEVRRAKLPKFIYKICDKCGWKSKLPFGDSDVRKKERPDYCLKCNSQGFVDGAIMREMTKKEAADFEKDIAEKEARGLERAFKAGLFTRNQSRQAEGLPPLSDDEYREEQRKEYARLVQRRPE